MNVGVFMSHYNRPQALERSLPQIVALGWPTLVVDDGSDDGAFDRAAVLCAEANVPLLAVPENRGLAAAMNVGLSYWLADGGVEWISYFQDDVDVSPQLPKALAAVQHAEDWPLVTGHDAGEHAQIGTATVGGWQCKLKANCRATHLHAHRDYWAAVMPVPTRRLGAPLPLDRLPPDVQARHRETGDLRGEGSEVDHWITHRAPQSIVKRGRFVLCAPGLVRTFLWRAEESCWGNRQRAGADPEWAQ